MPRWITPRTYTDRLDWADDKAWANFAANMSVAASLARDGGMKGLMLDPEEYASGRQYIHTPADPPFPATARLARQRGREVFSRVFKEYPDAVIFTLWYFGTYRNQTEKINPVGYADENGQLLPYFYNGMLDVMPTGIRVRIRRGQGRETRIDPPLAQRRFRHNVRQPGDRRFIRS